MKRILRVLTLHSVAELLRYKSFFLLVALLILVDRLVNQVLKVERPALNLPHTPAGLAVYVFEDLPGLLLPLLWDPRTLGVAAALFVLKQLISIWPSSDMRHMHRDERQGFLRSLLNLRWDQVAWDAIAVATLAGLAGGWGALVYGLTWAGWHLTGWWGWAAVAGGLLALVGPLLLAALSYSSKLAVLSQGRFGEKLALFYRLFLDWPLLWQSWVLFAVRMVLEGLFVAVIPVGILTTVENYPLRILLASLSAAPMYSYVKMASFKFFLEVYRRSPLVYAEYRSYYETGQGRMG